MKQIYRTVNWADIASGNLLPVCRQAMEWNNADLTGPVGTPFKGTFIKMQ